jgi:hypothetical protein
MDFDNPPLLFPLPSSPLRPTNWRWQLAESIAIPRRGRMPRWLTEYSDTYVLMAVDHLRGVKSKDSESRLQETIEQAWQLYNSPERVRCRLEARLLAGMPVDEVAAAEQLPPQVIEAFASLFFDVTGCLKATDYILSRAIVNQPYSFTLCSVGQTVKQLAYNCGSFLLSALLLELGWNTPWDRDLVGPDPGLGPHIRILLRMEDLPGEEFSLMAKLLSDEDLFSNSIRPIPAWIVTGLRRLETDRDEETRLNTDQRGGPAHSEAERESQRRAIA